MDDQKPREKRQYLGTAEPSRALNKGGKSFPLISPSNAPKPNNTLKTKELKN